MSHPHPYSVGWVMNSSTQRITHQCLVKFSVSNFKDTVFCDVIDMNSTHLLLGRPWQYDNRDNCYENTYTFYEDAKKKVLHPFKSCPLVKEHSDGINYWCVSCHCCLFIT